MEKLKFFILLRSLTDDELRAFGKYLKQLHGKEEIALRAFGYLRALLPNFRSDQKLLPAVVYRKTFGSPLPEDATGQKKALKKLLNTLSELHLWLKNFLLVEKLSRNDRESQTLWLTVLRERELQEEYKKQVDRFYTETRATTQKGTHDYFHEITASYLQHQQLALVRPAPDITALQRCAEGLKTSMEIMRLKVECQIINMEKIRPSTTAPAEKPEEEKNIPPLLSLYQDIYQLVKSGEEACYDRIEHNLAEYADQLNRDEIHGVFGYLQNHLADRSRNDQSSLLKTKAHRLNQFGLQQEIFKENGMISARQFCNIVTAACAAKDFVWADAFILQQSRFLPDDGRQEVIKLAHALVFFERSDLKKAADLLKDLELKDLHLIIRARLLTLRIYVDQKEDPDTILTYCESFESQLIRRRKPKTGAIEATLGVVRLIRMLILENTSAKDLIHRIEHTPHLYLREWLKGKAADYKGRYATHRRYK